MKEVALVSLTWLGSCWVCLSDCFTCTRARTHTHFLVHYLLMVCPRKKQLFRFGAVKLEGISTCGCYLVKRLFSFSGLSSFSVPHHTVRWPQTLSQGDDMQGPLEAWFIHLSSGEIQTAVQNDLAKAQAFKQVGRPEPSPWRMSSSVLSLAEPFFRPRGIKIRALLG